MGKYSRVIIGKNPRTYDRDCVVVDIYNVLNAFEVACPATQHAIKKLLMPGQRGHKDAKTDLQEAIAAIERAIELLPEEASS